MQTNHKNDSCRQLLIVRFHKKCHSILHAASIIYHHILVDDVPITATFGTLVVSVPLVDPDFGTVLFEAMVLI